MLGSSSHFNQLIYCVINQNLHYFVVESFAWLEQSTSFLLCYEFVQSYWFELRVELSYPKSYGGLTNPLHLACIVGDPRWDILRLGKFYIMVVSNRFLRDLDVLILKRALI